MNFNDLILPISIEQFLSQYKGEKHFVSKGNKDRFQNLLSWDKLNEILFTQRLDYPRFRLIRNGEVIEPYIYTDFKSDKRGGKIAKLNPTKLNTELRKGTAIHILAVEEFSEELTQICSRIGNEMQSEVGMTAHIGMHESKGFNLHWDSHDVLILQLYGKKRWKLYGLTEKYPFRIGPSRKENISNEIVWEGDLEEGDVLYLPRGYWHDVNAYEEPCMHISIGMFNPKPTDYLKWLNNYLTEFEFFRKDLPANPSDTDLTIFLTEVKEKLNSMITSKTYLTYLKEFSKSEKMDKFNLPDTKPLN